MSFNIVATESNDTDGNMAVTGPSPTTTEVLALAACQMPAHEDGVCYHVTRHDTRRKSRVTYSYGVFDDVPGVRLVQVTFSGTDGGGE